MTVTVQLQIIDDKMKNNQAQYDLGRLAAKISALSSGELREYEYLTGEDLGYKPSVVEQVKLDYSWLGRVFNKGLVKHDQKEGLLLKILKKKMKSYRTHLAKSLRSIRMLTMKIIFTMTLISIFADFTKTLENLKKMASLGSNRGELIDFYKLFRDFKNFELPKDDDKKLKIKVMKKTHQLYYKYFNAYKDEYDSEDLKEEDKVFLALVSTKYLVRKKKNEDRLKKMLNNQHN